MEKKESKKPVEVEIVSLQCLKSIIQSWFIERDLFEKLQQAFSLIYCHLHFSLRKGL